MAKLETNSGSVESSVYVKKVNWNTSAIFYTILLCIIGFIVLYPVLLLLIHTFQVGVFGQEYSWGLENWRTAFSDKNMREAIINTITLAISRQLIAIILGVFLAWLIARTDLPGKHWLELGFWIAMFMPALTVTLSWILLLDGYNGILNRWLEMLPFIEKGPFNIYSFWGINWVHLLTGTLPVKIMLLSPAFRNMDASLEEASRTSGASTLGTLIRITTPIMLPVILVSIVMGMIRSLEAFEVELILGVPQQIHVYSTLIYNFVFQEPPLYGQATVLSIASLMIIVPMVLIQQWASGRKSYTTISGKFSNREHKLGAWKWPAFVFVSTIVFIITIVPFTMIVLSSFTKIFGYFNAKMWTLENWIDVFSSVGFLSALKNTLMLSFGSMLLSIPLLFVIAYVTVRTKYRFKGALDFITWLPITLPGIVIGLGYLWLVLQTPILKPFYGSIWILIIVIMLGNITLGVQLMKTGMVQISNELEEASYVSGASLFYTMRRIILPLIAPAVAVVAVTIFASASKAVAHVALLSTPSNKPLAMLQLDMMADGRLEPATVVGVITMLLTVGVAILAQSIGLNLGPKR